MLLLELLTDIYGHILICSKEKRSVLIEKQTKLLDKDWY